MPPESRSTRITERCETHPSRAAVATCDRCGRRLCLLCAVPVRGEVVGQECLGEVLGAGAPPAAPPRPRRSGLDRAAGGALGLTVLCTLLPWTRFGTGSGFLGGWAFDPRWSMLAACASVLGLATWLLVGRRRVVMPVATIALGALVAVGGALAFWNPPPFTKSAITPIAAAAAGAAAAAIGALALLRPRAQHV